MSFHYKGNIAWSSLPGITSFHNLMYITHNRVYQGGARDRETRRGGGGGANARVRVADVGSHAAVCIETVSAKSALASACS